MGKKIAIVTGGTRGIGHSIVTSLLDKSYHVYFTYNSEGSKEIAENIERNSHCVAKGFRVNNTDRAALKKFVNHVLEDGVPDVLINNIGMNNERLLLETSFEEFWSSIEFNFGAAAHLCFLLMQPMIERRSGHIINISSVASKKVKYGNAAYGIAKASLERLTKALALELARFNIYVNAIAPSFVNTKMVQKIIETKGRREFFNEIPMRKILEPEHIGNLVLSLCQNQFSTTGTIFYIGNGENIIA